MTSPTVPPQPAAAPRALRGGPDVGAVLLALAASAILVGLLVGVLVTDDLDDVPVAVPALLAPASLLHLVWIGPFGFWRIDRDGLTIRALFGRWATRTLPWRDVATIRVHVGRGVTFVRVDDRIWHGVSPVFGVTRPLRILAVAAERGLLPAHLTVLLGHASGPRRPAGRRHVRRLRAAGVRVETRVALDALGHRRDRDPGPPPPPGR